MLAFLEAVVPVLDADQVATLAEELEAQCNERPQVYRGGRGGGQGRGPHGRGPHGRGPGMFLGRILHDLDGVTDEQAGQITEALDGNRQEFFDLRRAFAKGTISAEELRDGAKALRESVERALQSVLSDDQYSALEAALAEHRAEIATRRLENLEQGVARRLEFLTKVLALTDGQPAAVYAVLDESVVALRALLTPEQAEIFDSLRNLLPGHRGR